MQPVAESRVTRESLRALADLVGLDIGDDTLDELLPQVRRSAEATAALDALDLEHVEPASVFTPESE